MSTQTHKPQQSKDAKHHPEKNRGEKLTSSGKPNWLALQSQRVWTTLLQTFNLFNKISGATRAAAFSYYAFFSLFPLVVIFVKAVTTITNRRWAGKMVINLVSSYFPFNSELQTQIVDTITKVVHAQRHAGLIALLALVWVAVQFFATLIESINAAWSFSGLKWWRLPIKSLFLLCVMVGAVLLGVTVPMLVRVVKDWLIPVDDVRPWLYSLGSYLIPTTVVFVSLTLLYKLAPQRKTKFSEVWFAALLATILMRISENLFIIYLRDFATMNAVYGAFGGMMALLFWIYLSGCIYIFGACLCATQAGMKAR